LVHLPSPNHPASERDTVKGLRQCYCGLALPSHVFRSHYNNSSGQAQPQSKTRFCSYTLLEKLGARITSTLRLFHLLAFHPLSLLHQREEGRGLSAQSTLTSDYGNLERSSHKSILYCVKEILQYFCILMTKPVVLKVALMSQKWSLEITYYVMSSLDLSHCCVH
jgi:hypothetical protein